MRESMSKNRNVLAVIAGVVSIATIASSCMVQSVPAGAVGTPENLDQIFLRKARQRTNSYYSGEGANYIWQPQTLAYADITTGHEVWRLSNAPAVKSAFHDDISTSPWSADGKRMAYYMKMDDALGLNTTAYAGESGYNVWMIVDTDGSKLRPAVNGPSRTTENMTWFPWSPVLPDTYYMFGRTRFSNAVSIDKLYKAVVSDTDIAKTELLNFNNGAAMTIYHNGLSQDGKKVFASQFWTAGSYTTYPATIYPDGSAGIDVAGGYPRNISHDGNYWGDTPSSLASFHSARVDLLLGPDGKYWYYFMPSGSHTIWKAQLTGTATSGGPDHIIDHDAPYDFGEVWPMNAQYTGNNPYPSTHYWSHYAPDRWGKYMLYSDVDASPISPGVEDMASHSIYANAYGTGGVQHSDWHGWTDWFANTYGGSVNYSDDRISTSQFDDSNSTAIVAYAHTLYNNSGSYAGSSYEYSSLPRPGQSPDGTKIAYHSTFLNSKVGSYDDKPDIYYAVAYYPYPPEIKQAVKNGSNVRLTWDFNQGTFGNPNRANPRTYSSRGWPDEATDLPPAPREIDKFRVWNSINGNDWSPVGTASYNNTGGFWSESSWNFDTAQANGTTRYYALTSVEHSGLESRVLSNVWRVTTDASGNITVQTQASPYPSSPGGISSFFSTLPGQARNITVTHSKSPATASGQYTIEWQSPVADELVRYYNIYAKDGSLPIAIQQNRIASVPATSDFSGSGNYSYVDWLGNTDASTQYVITAVDFQGNESVAAGISAPQTTCTSWTFGYWSDCINGYQTRDLVESFPAGCTGGSPILSQSCQVSNPSATCTSWTYGDWSSCSGGYQTRSVISSSPSGCTGGNPVLGQSCQAAGGGGSSGGSASAGQAAAPSCSSWTYSAWSGCSNNYQTRSVISSSPSGCTGGSPLLSQSCQSVIATTTATTSQVAIQSSSGVDDDNDGLKNEMEVAIGTNMYKMDTDDDTYKDLSEILNNYDPTKAGAKLPISQTFSSKQKGKFLLQVQNRGQAWYVNPPNLKRYYLGGPEDAFAIMRKLGLGVKHKVITGTAYYSSSLSGRILIDVEDLGKAYYVNPRDRRAYYLGTAATAFEIMRQAAYGITEADIRKISIGMIN